MANVWKAVWNRRQAAEVALSGDWQDVFLELKRLNGFDVVDGGIPLNSLLMQGRRIVELLHLSAGMSVYDVGCGAGANLYLMQREGIAVGGTDYAATLVETARRVLPGARELTCGEADAFDTSLKYDAALSNSVFSYFPSEDFAARVLTRMLKKTTGAIGLIDLHDAAKEEDFLAYRRATIPDYDERYKGLGKFFYHRRFFEDFARAHNLRIEFPAIEMEGYWNTPFVFNVFMYRR
ncbi:methyltransferase domain protein [Selenomonas sp. FOBRC6]|uniref:class I SAM-dependent methyltransferase n=1 Tax=Selenomonas sp. FOBRC6 TaxID=936572 RepID=UPI0002781566|nr:methyltransferase domain-containing protein [Selenomonas sp. FOBRC6]EJO23283.1 methyltransferase domain protein [Selenomonas sp. FOBRC6]